MGDEDEGMTIPEAAVELGVHRRRAYQLVSELGITPARYRGRGRAGGAVLSRDQVEQMRAHRIARAEEKLRKVKGE